MIQFKKPNKRLFTIAMVMLVVGTAGLGLGIYQAHSSQADIGNEKPNYTTILPKGETIEQLGGWQKMTPPSGEVFFVYVDTIDGVTINVSQQRLPVSFRANTSQELAELARAYNATNKLDVNGTTVYIGTSAKGPQSVLFVKNDLLLLIKSWSTIENDSWIEYIQNLE